MEYQPQDNYNGNYYPEGEQYEYEETTDSTVKGLKIVVAALIIVLIVVGFLFWNRVRMDNRDAEMMKVEMDTLRSQLGTVQEDLNEMSFTNDSLNKDLLVQRGKADSLMEALTKEKRYRYSVVKKYEKELGTLRAAMKGFVRQIDSLNRVNQKLTGENISYRKQLANYKTRVESAEETASELQTKVNRGSVVKARAITMKQLNKRNKPANNAKSTRTLEVSFVLAANELANPGQRSVYVSIVDPNGAIISSSNKTIQIDSKTVPYTDSRDVDYTGSDLPVSVYCHGESFDAGKYTIMVYMDGFMIGSTDIIIKK